MAGCFGSTPPESESAPPSKKRPAPQREGEDAPVADASTPEGLLVQQLTDGFAEVNEALDFLETARRAGTDAMEAHTGTGEGKEAWLTYLDTVDSVGKQLTDLGSPPTANDVKSDFAASDEVRLDAIEELNIARFELTEATTMANSILGKETEGLFSDAWSAIDHLELAIDALGGKIQNPG